MSQMDKSFFDELYRREKNHWWFSCRRRLALGGLVRYGVNRPARILDMGCGTGAMLDELQTFGTGFGLDISETALKYCRERGNLRLTLGVGENLPYRAATFDGIVSLDVIEHIEEDLRTMQNLFCICREGAVVVITVPATPWLWTTRDERLLHKRRYTRPQLVALARAAGFEVVKCSYYCVFIFPIVAAVVLFHRLLDRRPDVRDDVPSVNPFLNAIFRWTLLCEQWLMRWLNYPFGVSLFCVLRKPDARQGADGPLCKGLHESTGQVMATMDADGIHPVEQTGQAVNSQHQFSNLATLSEPGRPACAAGCAMAYDGKADVAINGRTGKWFW